VQKIIKLLYNKRNGRLPDKFQLQRSTGLNNKRLDDIMNKLLKIIQDFLISGLSDEISFIQKQRRILSFYSEKELFDEYEYQLKKIEKRLAKMILISPDDQRDLFLFYRDTAVHEKIHQGRNVSVKIEFYEKYLDGYFWIEKLKLQCELVNREIVLNEETNVKNEVPGILLATDKLEKENAFICIYRKILLALTNPTFDRLDFWRELLFLYKNLPFQKSTYDETLTIGHYLINIALMRIKKGDSDFKSCMIEVISFMEEKNLLLERNVISSPIFKVAISVSLRANKISWAENFLRKYSPHLSDINSEEIIKYCKSLILFYRKQYDEADMILRSINHNAVDIYMKLNIRKLDIKIYIEHAIQSKQIAFPMLQHKVKSFRSFILDKITVGIENRDQLLRFLLYVRKSTHCLWGTNEARNQLLNKIKGRNDISEKTWLISLLK
jgi:hypothetical protein